MKFEQKTPDEISQQARKMANLSDDVSDVDRKLSAAFVAVSAILECTAQICDRLDNITEELRIANSDQGESY